MSEEDDSTKKLSHHNLLRTGHEFLLVVEVFEFRNKSEHFFHRLGRRFGGLSREEKV